MTHFTRVLTGLEALLRQPQLLHGRRIGLVTNPTGVTRDLTPVAEALLCVNGVELRALFGPEHGLRGAVQDAIAVRGSIDPASGLPVHSLYGEHRKPSAGMLDGLSTLVFDMQDIGCRYYTYAYTLSYIMEAAAEHGIEVIVLDRPNPITGAHVEGPVLSVDMASFVGRYPIPVRHGLTIGEFARYINAEFAIGCTLTVVPMGGWRHAMWFDQTGLPWVAPSPNIATPDTCAVYPGTCLFEGTNLSEGRGTTHPFEWIGAPWVDGPALAAGLNGRGIPGVRFRAIEFEPTFGKHMGAACQGVQVHVVDRVRLRPFELGLHMLVACLDLFRGEFEFLPTSWEGQPPHIDLLTGDPAIRLALLDGADVREIARRWSRDVRAFARQRTRSLLYD
jgi:uncharacterized protein YbbC (DUF1343 family)